MGSDSIPLWCALILCVIGGAYFAATESSFSAANKIKIKAMADDGSKHAKGVMYILNKFEKALSTLLVGNNVTKIAGAAIFTILATDIAKDHFGKSDSFIESFAFSMICSALSTAIIFLFSEMIPKSFANDRSETVSLFFEGSLRFLMKALHPVSAFFTLISDRVARLFASGDAEPSITEDELTEIIVTAEEEGIVDEEQGDMLKSALEFSKTTVDEIMTMNKDVVYVHINDTTEQILETILSTTHSRLPVKAANSDRVIGILRARAFLTEYKRNPQVKLRTVMSPPYIVRSKAKIDGLLNDMRQHKCHLAIVCGNDKKVVGIVTIEDILEELVGEIFDEDDQVDKNFYSMGGNRYMVNTHMLLGTAYERMGLTPPAPSLAGKPIVSFVLETLGHLPAEDEKFLHGNLEFSAKSVDEKGVTEVVIHILDPEELAERTAPAAEEEVRV